MKVKHLNINLPLIFCGLVTANAYALGRTIEYPELADHYFGTIQQISICGEYYKNEQLGQYRLIQSLLYGSDMIFVDQVEYIDSQFKVIRGFTFSEMNNDHAELSLINLSCHVKTDTSVIISGNADGSGHDDNNKYRFTITLDTRNGNYTFNEHTE